jgi:hypothetical protein
MSQQQQRQPNFDNIIPSPTTPPSRGTLTPWTVARAIPDSIGSIDKIAKTLGVPRPELRKFINDNPELREALDDEILAAKERLMEKTYSDGMDGSPVARQDFFKMVNGYFEKRDTAKTGESQPQIVIHLDAPKQTYKMLSEDGQITEVDRKIYEGQQSTGVGGIDDEDDDGGAEIIDAENDEELDGGGNEDEEDGKKDSDSF